MKNKENRNKNIFTIYKRTDQLNIMINHFLIFLLILLFGITLAQFIFYSTIPVCHTCGMPVPNQTEEFIKFIKLILTILFYIFLPIKIINYLILKYCFFSLRKNNYKKIDDYLKTKIKKNRFKYYIFYFSLLIMVPLIVFLLLRYAF